MDWKRRGGAFLIDYALLVAVWEVIDHSIVAPIPEFYMSVAEVVVFCLYFTLTEGLGRTRASPGKRLLGLSVVMRDGCIAPTRVILGRAAILSLFLVADWDRFIWLFDGDLPLIAYILPTSTAVALAVFNAWLAFRGREGVMLQDGLSGSQVVFGPVSMTGKESGPVTARVPKEWPSPSLCLALIAVFFVGMLSLTVALGARPLAPSFAIALGFELEESFVDMADVRMRVEVTENLEITDGAQKRYLEIEIWLPYRAYITDTVASIELHYSTFASRAEDFDAVLLKPWTEIGIAFLSWTHSGETWIDLKAPDFQFKLAVIYDEGAGVAKDDGEAVKWYRRAAEQGHRMAQYNLAVMYETGEGVEEDETEAAAWYRKAAEQGHPGAQHNLALMYLSGEGVAEDKAEAAVWFRKAAEQGQGGSQHNLALMYATGEGVAEDKAEAAVWFRKAAEQGQGSSQHKLALMYATGEGVAEDKAEAAVWYRKAAERGYAKSQFSLGFALLRGSGVEPDPMEAARWWRAAAGQGHAGAQYAYGYLCSKGEGVSLSLTEALAWYQKAAAQGDSWAQYALGSHYLLGAGVEQDPDQAARWFQLVAGDDDYAAAVESFERAAEGGEDDAQFFLGMMHRYGHGVPVDHEKAMGWLQKAADAGYVVADVPLNQMHEGG